MIARLIPCADTLKILDQRLLPHKISYIRAKTPQAVAKAIKDMAVRGAPLIGCCAAYGLALSLNSKSPKSRNQTAEIIKRAARLLKSSRPTATALSYAVDRMSCKAMCFIKNQKKFCEAKFKKLQKLLLAEAHAIYNEDVSACEKLSASGSALIKKKINVMTICNAGALATAGIGTALGIIYKAFKRGKINRVYVCETRPYLQGARLTMFELMQNKIPSILITDNMAAHIMKTCRIGAVIAGADRIALNGETANKIGTYMLAVLAKYHKIPFYIAAPTPTMDPNSASGAQIPIEERSPGEVCCFNDKSVAPKSAKARHPAFDVTPANLITAIITERGVISPVSRKNLCSVIARRGFAPTKQSIN